MRYVLLCLLLSGCNLDLGPIPCLKRYNKSTVIRWEELPLTYRIASDVPEKYRESIIASAEHWNSTYGKALLKNDQTSPNIIWWDTKWTEANKILAYTTNSSIGSVYTGFTIHINAQDHTFYVDNSDEYWGYQHLESVMTHEFGHALGLLHTEWGVMDSAISSNTELTNLSNLKCDF